MQSEGTLFLSRTRPLATQAADGEFQLTLLAMDRIGTHQVEPWRITWAGTQAQAFWHACKHALTPGQPLHVVAQRVRAHSPRHCAPEIHATASWMELAPTAARRTGGDTDQQPQAAAA